MADTDTSIIFREIEEGITVSNNHITLLWEKKHTPSLKIISGSAEIPINQFQGYEITGSFLDELSEDQIVSRVDSNTASGWRYTTSRLLSGKGFQIEHTQSIPLNSTPSKNVSLSVANTISNGELYYQNKKIIATENLQTITLSGWTWFDYDDILAARVSIGSDMRLDDEGEMISHRGSAIREISPYSTHASLLHNNKVCGVIKWSHEAEIHASMSKVIIPVRVYATSTNNSTDLIFVFLNSYGAERVSYSYIIEVAPPGEKDGSPIDYTLPVVFGIVVTLILAAVMFRSKIERK
jgi:hypothetical protein